MITTYVGMLSYLTYKMAIGAPAGKVESCKALTRISLCSAWQIALGKQCRTANSESKLGQHSRKPNGESWGAT